MKRCVVFVVLALLSLAEFWLGSLSCLPALAAELNGFAIQTQDKDKAVTITLFTDQRVQYATEHQGKQFTILLPNTQVSPEQMKNGLPVVVDDKNHFIGRAVPAEGGKVKIVLPNLSAGDYAVSIQQKRSPLPKTNSDSAAKPRSAVNFNASSPFDQAFDLPIAPASHGFPGFSESSESGNLRPASTTPHRVASGPNTRNLMWNPYVVKPAPVTREHAAPDIQPTKAESKPAAMPEAQLQSSGESFDNPLSRLAFPAAFSPAPAKDPLLYLHSLPVPAPNPLPVADLKTLAAEDAATQAQVKPSESKAPKPSVSPIPASSPTSYTKGLLRELKLALKSVPQWVFIILAVFMGGLGLFTLAGGLVLLKVLFNQAVPSVQLAGNQPATLSGVSDVSAESKQLNKRQNQVFEDKASISALDYLKRSPDSIPKAVHNTSLLKFPNQRKHRTGSKRLSAPSSLKMPTYGTRP